MFATSLASEAYGIVRQRILRGELKFGDVISRRSVAAELGMSFLPVSEAFLRLEFEGLLESRPRAGTRVRIPTPEEVEGHFAVREGLEMQAAERFADMATDDELCELMRLAKRVDSIGADKKSNRAKFLALHERLHRRIAECARSSALCSALEKNSSLSATWLCLGHHFRDARPMRCHQELVKALSGGVPAAIRAMREHIDASRATAMEYLDPYFQLSQESTQPYTRRPKT